MDFFFGKIRTLLIAAVLLRVTQGISHGKHLPSLLREKRLDTLEDEPASNEPVEYGSSATDDTMSETESSENQHRLSNSHVALSDKSEKRKKSHYDVNEGIGAEILNELKSKQKLSKSKTNDEPKIDQHRISENDEPKTYKHRIPGKNDKIILPGMQFDFIRQDTAKLPRPNKEMLHQFKLNLKRKIRRRLRASKKLEQMRTKMAKADQEPLVKSALGRTRQQITSLPSSSRFSRLPKSFSKGLRAQYKIPRMFSVHNAPTSKTYIKMKSSKRAENPNHSSKESLRAHSKTPTLSSLPSVKTSKLNSSKPKQTNKTMGHPTKPLTRQKRLSPSKDDLLDSSMKLSSTLRFTFSSPFQGQSDSISKSSTSPPTTSAADSPTAMPHFAPSPSVLPDFPPSLKEIPSEDLMMLNDFFNHATAFKQQLNKAKIFSKKQHHVIHSVENKEKQSDNYLQMKNDHEEVKKQNPGKKENEEFGYNSKNGHMQHYEEIPSENHDRKENESNAYAKQLLEFQRKAIEAEEKRIDEDIRGNKQHKVKKSRRWRKHLHELEQETQDKQHEVHKLFEELAEKWKHRRNQALQGGTTSKSRKEKPLGGNETLGNENQRFEQFTNTRKHNLTLQDMNSQKNAGDYKDSKAKDGAQEHDLFDHLSAKWKNRQSPEKERDHKFRWLPNGDHANEENRLDRKANEMNRKRKMFSQGNQRETPTKALQGKEDGDDIVEMAFKPTLRRFSPPIARIHNKESNRKAIEVSITNKVKILSNTTAPTSSINHYKNSYFKENSTIYALTGQKVFKVNKGKYEQGNATKSEHTIYDNDDDDATEDVDIVYDNDDDAPPHNTNGVKNRTALPGHARKKKVNDTSIKYNPSEINDDNVKNDLEDDDRELENNDINKNNSHDNNNEITDINNDNHIHGNHSDNYNMPNNLVNKTVNDYARGDNKLSNMTGLNDNKNNGHNITSDNSNYNNDDNARNNTAYNNEEVPRDDRLLYILGDPEQVTKKQRSRERIEELVRNVKLNDNELTSRRVVLDKQLRAKLKSMEIRVLDAHQKVSKELEDIERHLTNRYERLQNSIRQAKSLTKGMDNKINDTILHVLKLAKMSADKAKSKIHLVQKAATALTDIEKRIGANETRNVARVIKSRIAELPVNKYRSYQRILAVNNLITKMDGARLLAESKANSSFSSKDEIEKNMADIATNVLEELTSAENELNTDTKVEMEDEREAEEKLEDAERRNFKVALKSGEALKRIEGYLEQLEKEEKKLRNTSTS